MQAGMVEISPSDSMFQWLIQSDTSDWTLPLVLWLNGGPGASSLTGILVEKIGPFTLSPDGTLVPNSSSWTQFANILVVDNPVGVGQSVTSSKDQVQNEFQMSEQFQAFLVEFYKGFTELHASPLQLVGESQAGKQIPQIANQIQKQDTTGINLAGLATGNGWQNPIRQQASVTFQAYSHGFIDEKHFAIFQTEYQKCFDLINKKDWTNAEKFCENIESDLYSLSGAFSQDTYFYSNILADLNTRMGMYLNDPQVQAALHTHNTWVSSDETGPVADALIKDMEQGLTAVIDSLLESGLKWLMQNGERDGSSCNHIGNWAVITKDLDSAPARGLAECTQLQQQDKEGNVLGFIREFNNFKFVKLMNTGHLVPMIVPETGNQLIRDFIENEFMA